MHALGETVKMQSHGPPKMESGWQLYILTLNLAVVTIWLTSQSPIRVVQFVLLGCLPCSTQFECAYIFYKIAITHGLIISPMSLAMN